MDVLRIYLVLVFLKVKNFVCLCRACAHVIIPIIPDNCTHDRHTNKYRTWTLARMSRCCCLSMMMMMYDVNHVNRQHGRTTHKVRTRLTYMQIIIVCAHARSSRASGQMPQRPHQFREASVLCFSTRVTVKTLMCSVPPTHKHTAYTVTALVALETNGEHRQRRTHTI